MSAPEIKERRFPQQNHKLLYKEMQQLHCTNYRKTEFIDINKLYVYSFNKEQHMFKK